MEYPMFDIGLILFGVVALAIVAIDAWDDHKRDHKREK